MCVYVSDGCQRHRVCAAICRFSAVIQHIWTIGLPATLTVQLPAMMFVFGGGGYVAEGCVCGRVCVRVCVCVWHAVFVCVCADVWFFLMCVCACEF